MQATKIKFPPTRLSLLPLLAGLAVFCSSAQSSNQPPAPGKPGAPVEAWVTTSDKTRLLARDKGVFFGERAPLPLNIDVDPERRYQEMVGFGAAITDASAWLMQNRMSSRQRNALLRELFGRAPGIGFSFTRLTIGASDYSRSHYSLNDLPPGQTDPTLANFSIDPNWNTVLPVVKKALAINPQLKVMASPWSAPAWMKSNDSLLQGTLRPEAYGVFADYLRRYVEAYTAEGVPIFALTVQNEPHFEPLDYPGMRLDPAARARLIGQHLGPLFERRRLKTQILDWDHNWDQPESPLQVLADPVAAKYVSGVAWHCYKGNVRVQSAVHDAYPDKDAYFTECSGGEWAPEWGGALIWNMRNLIIGSTRGWAKGVLFWNLALDENHGPHLGGCTNCRGVVTVDSASGRVTRNVEYYVLAHASRFVRPGARRIESGTGLDGLESVAFRNADDGSLALIVLNAAADARSFSVRQANLPDQSFTYALPAGSVATFVWKPKH